MDNVHKELPNNDELIDENDDIDEEEEGGESDDDFKEQVSFELLEPDAESKLDDEYGEIHRFTNALSEAFV